MIHVTYYNIHITLHSRDERLVFFLMYRLSSLFCVFNNQWILPILVFKLFQLRLNFFPSIYFLPEVTTTISSISHYTYFFNLLFLFESLTFPNFFLFFPPLSFFSPHYLFSFFSSSLSIRITYVFLSVLILN